MENKIGLSSYLIAVNIIKADSLDLYSKKRDKIEYSRSIDFGIGQVVAMGPDCYQGERFEESGPWCYLNDYIICDMRETTKIQHKNFDHALYIINDDKVHWALTPASYDLEICLKAYMRGWKNSHENANEMGLNDYNRKIQ